MYNEAILIGRVGQPPRVSQPGSGERKLAIITLATTRRWRDLQGVVKEEATWHTVEGWEGNADILAAVQPGDLLFVQGYIKNEKTPQGVFHSAVVAQKVLRLFTRDQGRLTRRQSLEELSRLLSDHDWDVLCQLRRAQQGG